jgi:hypothetical protein
VATAIHCEKPVRVPYTVRLTNSLDPKGYSYTLCVYANITIKLDG